MTIDTNILIAYLNGEEAVQTVLNDWKRANRPLFVSAISVAEILALPDLTASMEQKIKNFLDEFISVPFDDNLARRTASVRRKYKLKLPDAAIAATALDRGTPLITRDTQFRKVRELIVVAL